MATTTQYHAEVSSVKSIAGGRPSTERLSDRFRSWPNAITPDGTLVFNRAFTDGEKEIGRRYTFHQRTKIDVYFDGRESPVVITSNNPGEAVKFLDEKFGIRLYGGSLN